MFQQLETIDERELIPSLELIQGKLVGAEETINYCNVMDSLGDLEDGWRKLEMLRALRVQAIQKCSQKLTEVQAPPRVKLGSLTEFLPESPLATEPLEVKEECPSPDPKWEPDDDPRDYDPLDDGTSHWEISDEEDAKGDPLELADPGGASHSEFRAGEEVKESSSGSPSSGLLPPPKVLNQNYTMEKETGQLKCCLCSRKFKAAATFYKHFRNAHRPEPQNYPKDPESGKYECSLCQKQFTQTTAAIFHYQKSHLDVKYQCPVPGCGKDFVTRQSYKIHHQKVHRRRFMLQRRECSSSVTRKRALVGDMNTAHFKSGGGVAPAPNPGGNASVESSRDNSTSPVKEVHLKLREHVCGQCGKSFTRLSNLKCHLKNVHSTSSEKHHCEECGKVFKAALYLKMHASRVHVRSREFESL